MGLEKRRLFLELGLARRNRSKNAALPKALWHRFVKIRAALTAHEQTLSKLQLDTSPGAVEKLLHACQTASDALINARSLKDPEGSLTQDEMTGLVRVIDLHVSLCNDARLQLSRLATQKERRPFERRLKVTPIVYSRALTTFR